MGPSCHSLTGTAAVPYNPRSLRRHSQVVRQGSAKPSFPGSNPGGASSLDVTRAQRRQARAAGSLARRASPSPGARRRVAAAAASDRLAGLVDAGRRCRRASRTRAPRRSEAPPPALGPAAATSGAATRGCRCRLMEGRREVTFVSARPGADAAVRRAVEKAVEAPGRFAAGASGGSTARRRRCCARVQLAEFALADKDGIAGRAARPGRARGSRCGSQHARAGLRDRRQGDRQPALLLLLERGARRRRGGGAAGGAAPAARRRAPRSSRRSRLRPPAGLRAARWRSGTPVGARAGPDHRRDAGRRGLRRASRWSTASATTSTASRTAATAAR